MGKGVVRESKREWGSNKGRYMVRRMSYKKNHPKAIKILKELNLSVVEAGICIVGNLHSKEVFGIYELIEWNELT